MSEGKAYQSISAYIREKLHCAFSQKEKTNAPSSRRYFKPLLDTLQIFVLCCYLPKQRGTRSIQKIFKKRLKNAREYFRRMSLRFFLLVQQIVLIIPTHNVDVKVISYFLRLLTKPAAFTFWPIFLTADLYSSYFIISRLLVET